MVKIRLVGVSGVQAVAEGEDFTECLTAVSNGLEFLIDFEKRHKLLIHKHDDSDGEPDEAIEVNGV